MSTSREKMTMAEELFACAPEYFEKRNMSVEDLYESSFDDRSECENDEERYDTSIITWPFVQALFSNRLFRDNSALLTSSYYREKYGEDAYAVLNVWLEEMDADTKARIKPGISKEEGPDFREADYNGTFDRDGYFTI